MFSSFMIVLISLIISMIFLMISMLISKHFSIMKLNFSPFECGFSPFNSTRMSFSLQFFFIAILFLVFDIEIILLLPFPIINLKSMTLAISILGTFLILIFGLIYEWKSNALKWM